MKKKSTTYFLILAVIGLWGGIGYKIFYTLKPFESIKHKTTVDSFLTEEKKSSTPYRLLPTYGDPFLKGGFIESETIEVTNFNGLLNDEYDDLEVPYKEENITEEKAAYFPNIIYKGIIKSNSKGKRAYLIQINDKNEIIQGNEEKQGVLILEGNREKIKVSFNGEIRAVHINQN